MERRKYSKRKRTKYQSVRLKHMRAKDFPSWVAIIKTKSNKFRYTIRYPDKFIKLKESKTHSTHAGAYRAAMRAAKAYFEGVINFIQ